MKTIKTSLHANEEYYNELKIILLKRKQSIQSFLNEAIRREVLKEQRKESNNQDNYNHLQEVIERIY